CAKIIVVGPPGPPVHW
nr:immunoglobulin heavy chain junction region [Macaca mulatta]MOV58914.1 immunoglobulin heavy chain junction region [Macaca mulatta]